MGFKHQLTVAVSMVSPPKNSEDRYQGDMLAGNDGVP